jgi:hypothetical protein
LPSGEIVDQEKPSFKETIELTDMPTEKAQIDIGIPPEEIRTTSCTSLVISKVFLKVTSCSCCGARISISTEGCFGANSTVSSNLSSFVETVEIQKELPKEEEKPSFVETVEIQKELPSGEIVDQEKPSFKETSFPEGYFLYNLWCWYLLFNNAWPFWQNFNTFGIFHVFGYFW